MVSLVDIAPQSKTVHGVEVRGISAKGVAYLLATYPELRKLLTGVSVEPDTLASAAPEVVAAIIACGCGDINNPEAEAAAARLSVDMQLDFLEAIITLTMPQGLGPFVARLERLSLGAGHVEQVEAKEAATS